MEVGLECPNLFKKKKCRRSLKSLFRFHLLLTVVMGTTFEINTSVLYTKVEYISDKTTISLCLIRGIIVPMWLIRHVGFLARHASYHVNVRLIPLL